MRIRRPATLVALSGLPGTGKSSIARGLALELDAIWLRIDSIEQAIRQSGVTASLDDAGYRVGYALAEDNLKLGHTVIADSVNPWMLTRDAWRAAGLRAAAPVVEVELICSDIEEHRRRIETRPNEIAGLELPSWDDVMGRDYRPWDRARNIVDTAGQGLDACLAQIHAILSRPTA